MPRPIRVFAPGFPQHIVQRGNNRANVFLKQDDYLRYLELLKKHSRRWSSQIIAYCLMTNHVHIIARPARRESLPKMMQCTAQAYSKYFNKKYQRTGRFWESRYYASPIQKESYLWAAVRYVEQNPRRAGMLPCDQSYPFSSAKAHLAGLKDDVLGEDLFSLGSMQDYKMLFSIDVRKEEFLPSVPGTESPSGAWHEGEVREG